MSQRVHEINLMLHITLKFKNQVGRNIVNHFLRNQILFDKKYYILCSLYSLYTISRLKLLTRKKIFVDFYSEFSVNN